MKPFDLEAAKAGAAFYYAGSPNSAMEKKRVSFIGVRASGDIVYDTVGGTLCYAKPTEFRMAPKKVRAAVNLWRDPKSGHIAVGGQRFATFLGAKDSAGLEPGGSRLLAPDGGVAIYTQYVGTTYVDYEE